MNRSFKTAVELQHFLKTESGTAAGGPRGSKHFLTTFKELRDKKLRVVENGRARWITGNELTVYWICEHAMKGNLSAIERWMLVRKKADRSDAQKSKYGYLVTPEQMTVEEWQKEHNITSTSELARRGAKPGDAS